jgi:peptidoglycan/xylan/chitin deacetylase (PgdA/CDA1 family)
MPKKKRNRAITVIFLFLLSYTILLLIKPFVYKKVGKVIEPILISWIDFSNFVFKKPFLYNLPETYSEEIFKQEVQRQATLFPHSFFLEKTGAKQKIIALTFDDSPDDWYCPQILGILEKYKVKATFFLIGNRLKQYRQNAIDIKAQGHLIGNHSYSHQKYSFMTMDEIQKDIDSAEVAFQEQIQCSPTVFRPPYGMITDEQIIALSARRYKIINWSIDTYDWDNKRNTPLEIFTRVEQYAHSGAIVLMHSSGKDREYTIQALPIIIKSLKDRGFDFVTVDEMFYGIL